MIGQLGIIWISTRYTNVYIYKHIGTTTIVLKRNNTSVIWLRERKVGGAGPLLAGLFLIIQTRNQTV